MQIAKDGHGSRAAMHGPVLKVWFMAKGLSPKNCIEYYDVLVQLYFEQPAFAGAQCAYFSS